MCFGPKLCLLSKLWFLFRVSEHHTPHSIFKFWIRFLFRVSAHHTPHSTVPTSSSLYAAPSQLLFSYARRRHRNSFFFMLRRRHNVRSRRCVKAMTTFAAVWEGSNEHERRNRVFFGSCHGLGKPMDRPIQPLDYWIAPIQRGSDPTRFCLKKS